MKAIIWTKYGPPEGLQIQEVAQPVPRENEILIKIHATTVTAGDCEMRRLKIPALYRLPFRLYVGISRPQRITILGQELAGEVVATGADVTGFKVGDPVFGTTGITLGAYAEYICLPEKAGAGALARKPIGMTYEQAAAVPVGGLEALHFIRKADLQGGEKALIYGAGGSIGTFAVQLARYYGADVTAVDSAGKLEMLRSLGASRVIDYTREDFTRGGETYDVIFDVVGKCPFPRGLRALKDKGVFLTANPGLRHRLRGPGGSRAGGKRVIHGTGPQKAEDLVYLGELIETGKIRVVVDRIYPFEQMVEAHRYVDAGLKQGGVVVREGDCDNSK